LGACSVGNDGEVVGNLGVVEDALVRDDPVARQNLVRERREPGQQRFVVPFADTLAGQHLERVLHRTEIVLGQRARVGPRIGQHLVLFVQRLCQPQGGFCRKAEAAVRFALQAGEVVKQGDSCEEGLASSVTTPGLFVHFALQRLGAGFVPQTVGAQVFVFLALCPW
jgi:hypothetical protein